MDNRHLFLSAGGLLLAGTAPAARPAKPNVIIIYTDDHGTLDMPFTRAAASLIVSMMIFVSFLFSAIVLSLSLLF